MTSASIIDLGRMRYVDALACQRSFHRTVAQGEREPTWLIVEHEPVITLGRNAKLESLLLSRSALQAKGVDVVEVERGGDVTYHGPGQLVVYPIMKLARFREIVPLVTAIESSVIAALSEFGISAVATGEHRGVYVERNAICAIGLSVKQMTTMHGLALNVNTALDYDRLITPCGTPQFGITSMSRELGREVTLKEARDALLRAFSATFDVRFREASATACAPGGSKEAS
jgi:lipoyl(octanoyl) transferase